MLAMSMLPDGAETQSDDWTIFFLNQTHFNTISPGIDTNGQTTKDIQEEYCVMRSGRQELLCVLNLVRTKKDKTLDRGAKVLALALCTRHPYIQIFKPFLLLALDDYFSDPSQACLSRLFDAVNTMDLSLAPTLTRDEKLVMRFSDRKDIFSEKFPVPVPRDVHFCNMCNNVHAVKYPCYQRHAISDKEPSQEQSQNKDTRESAFQHQQSYDSSTSIGGSALWVGEESRSNTKQYDSDEASGTDADRPRKSIDIPLSVQVLKEATKMMNSTQGYFDSHIRSAIVKDTHFFHTTAAYRDHQLPIKMPLSTFPEEVGDYSLITLIKVFSSHQLVSGPIHPHLHTNGSSTHPIIILFNALITGKSIIFLGHKKPAGDVSSFVLAACALGSGCGTVLRGFIDRAFPYATLENRDEWENVSAYIAGVTNPIFETSRTWDLLLDIGSGVVTVSRDIHLRYPVINVAPIMSHSLRPGILKMEASFGSEDEIGRKESKMDNLAKIDYNTDKNFIEDIRSAIEDHFGESLVRMRFTEYVMRFVRLASRYEEEVTGTTKIGYPSIVFVEGGPDRPVQLGSGMVFNDDATCVRELIANTHRIQAWRMTNSYQYYVCDFARQQATSAIQGLDVLHQVLRLRNSKNISEAEVIAILRTFADNVKSYEQVVELLAYLLPYGGGLLHLGFGLLHQRDAAREATVQLFNQFRAYPVGVLFLQTLNHFQRYAFVRQAHAREKGLLGDQHSAERLDQRTAAF
ncbi:hypothetical protein AMATHDRAFT_69501 [Amanita thiersii Skay4041]|uniref:UDENN domain-containing protein n=1 Tax=Amanita thiersii Skay4041 TaxID=703135 RepID=A0A2A9N9E2_9AGAR|nr:hypothetical protein AMATHDRAFT_69501 [Amanita thiersii Skay4041]